MSTNVKTKATMTAEQRQVLYGHLLERLNDDVTERYARAKDKFAETGHLGYEYATQWRLESVLVAEFLVRDMQPVILALQSLIAGEMSEEKFLEDTLQHRREMTGELVRARPWEHRSTCGLTSLMGTFKATAKSEAIQMIDHIEWRLVK